MLDPNYAALSSPVFQPSECVVACRTRYPEPTKGDVEKIEGYFQSVAEQIEGRSGIIYKNFGPVLADIGTSVSPRDPTGNIYKVVGKNLVVLGKEQPLTVEYGLSELMKKVRGGDAWEPTIDGAAQLSRFHTLGIIFEALKASASDDKVPDWVNPPLAQFLTEMIVRPLFTDDPMIEDCMRLMEPTIYVLPSGANKMMDGLYADEVAEKTTARACETLEALLCLNPALAEVARETVKAMDAEIHSDECLLDKRLLPVAVVALDLASVSITKATELSPEVARRRLKNTPNSPGIVL